MNKLSVFLDGVLRAFVITTDTQPSYHTHDAKTGISKTNDTAQDWQMVGVDISNASKKVANNMVRYEPKTT